MIPEPSGEQKAADEAAFSASLAETMADNDRRQAQAKAFQEVEGGDVTAGQERLI